MRIAFPAGRPEKDRVRGRSTVGDCDPSETQATCRDAFEHGLNSSGTQRHGCQVTGCSGICCWFSSITLLSINSFICFVLIVLYNTTIIKILMSPIYSTTHKFFSTYAVLISYLQHEAQTFVKHMQFLYQ